MLCGRAGLLTRCRYKLHCWSTNRTQAPLQAKPEIIFEHAEVLAINKPPGVAFHSTDQVLGVIPTLRCMETEGLLPQLGPLYPLHRSRQATHSCHSAHSQIFDACMCEQGYCEHYGEP